MSPTKRLLTVLLGAVMLVGARVTLATAQTENILIQQNVPVPMRDGVVLRADIYRPAAPGKFPVLLERTPYNKAGEVETAYKAAGHGYVVIIQDCRGRYASAGEWYTFKHESADGYDTVEWAAKLPYSNGKVGMFGGSYVGATQMLAAIAHPPHLAGIFPTVTASNYHRNWTYQGGALTQWFDQSWASGLAQNTLDRRVADATDAVNYEKALPLDHFSLFPAPATLGIDGLKILAPYYLDWLRHPTYDDYWKQWSIEADYSRIRVPAFHIGGWYDLFLDGTLRNYMGIKAHGGTAAARDGQRLLIIVGGHAGMGRKVGDVDFGAQSVPDIDGLMIRWYDYLFKGVQNGMAQEKPVKYFEMGRDEWREASDWPPPGARATRFYLHSEGKANTATGDGALSEAEPEKEAPNRFVYDPANPVPTLGGRLCCDSIHLEPGARDQRSSEARKDVLVFSTPVFKHDFVVTGPVHLVLYASSSAPDTDFTAMLTDIGPDGFARNITGGIIRARYRDSMEQPEFMTPGKIYKFTIDMWATSNDFLAGHRLRLDVSSSNFPRFDRNLNTRENPEAGTHWVKATNTIYHDGAHPSALVLPVMPN
ncbi:MAG TPA: CocE/NonD family hydrolase [Terriglobia bacterium]|nr:CocE/NonD family hydrolase [Terriglobia bacterium]